MFTALNVLAHLSKIQYVRASNNEDLPLALLANNPILPIIFEKSTTLFSP